MLLPAVEDGIFNDSWRIRQSSVELLGDLLFKVNVFFNLFFFSFSGASVFFLDYSTPSRLLERLEKLYLRVVVMMKGLALKHMGEQSLRFLGRINVMRSLLPFIWFELMSAYLCGR